MNRGSFGYRGPRPGASPATIALCAIALAVAAASMALTVYVIIQGGPQGPRGPSGAAGAAGSAGAPGLAGPTGSQGPAGADGATGPAGPTGATGAAGGAPILIEYYINETGVPTSFPDATTWVKVAGTTAYTVQHADFSHSDNRFTYVGSSNLIAHGSVSFSYSTSTSTENIRMAIAKNGAIVASSILERRTETANDLGSSSIHFACTMTTNDYVEVHALHTTWGSGKTATFEFMNVAMLLPSQGYNGTIP